MEICTECPKESKHKYPYPLCDKHYVDKFSYQVINGVKMPFKEWLQGELEKQGLWFNEGETRREWFARMEEHGRSALPPAHTIRWWSPTKGASCGFPAAL